MGGWNIIASAADIDKLLDQYGGFHDSCLVELYYRSGSYVDHSNAMIFGPREGHELHIVFHSQWYKQPIELCFNGIRQCNIVGFQDNYFLEILDCHLAYHNDLITGRDDPLIVWADFAEFSPSHYSLDKILHEPAVTYVIAEKLKWRFIADNHDA